MKDCHFISGTPCLDKGSCCSQLTVGVGTKCLRNYVLLFDEVGCWRRPVVILRVVWSAAELHSSLLMVKAEGTAQL